MPSILKKIYQVLPFKRPLFEAVRAVYVPPKFLYRHLFFEGKFKVRVDGGFFYMNHYNTHGFVIEDDLFWQGLGRGREGVSLQLWQKLCKEAQVIFDLGANTGLYSLVAKTVNPSSRVFGFEPIKRTFDRYKANCELNGFDVRCEWMAVSDQVGEAVIYDVPLANNFSATLNKTFSDTRHAVHADSRFQTRVKTETLANYIELHRLPRVDLMKVDVEMHEPEVLRGMGPYLKRYQPTLLIEIMTNEIGRGVEEVIRECGYRYFSINESGQVEPKRSIEAINESNYLICTPAVAGRLGLA